MAIVMSFIFASLLVIFLGTGNGDSPSKPYKYTAPSTYAADSPGVAPSSGRLIPPLDTSSCHHSPEDASKQDHVPLPQLDQQFEAHVEAKIIQKGYTVEVVEYYDYPRNRGLVRRMKNGETSTWLYDFQHYESFLIVGTNCWLSDMRQEGFQFFNFTLGKDGGHIGGVTDLFNFGTQYNETYIGGNETVRGIPVDHWTSCVEWERFSTVFRLDYYFSKPDYVTALGRRQVPVRAVLQGQASDTSSGPHTFHHIYDFTFYRPGPITDKSVFEVPHGTVCRHKTATKSRPALPDSFHMEFEMVEPGEKVVSLRKYYYDYKQQLSRYDLKPNARSMSSWGDKYGYRAISLIHDHIGGIQYVIDSEARNCSVEPITLDSLDDDSRMRDPSHLIMKHGRELFDLDQLQFSYQGKRQFRQMVCEVWAAVRVNWPQNGTNTTVEVYFSPANWTIESPNMDQRQPLIVGLWLTLVDEVDNYVSEWINNIFSYSSSDPDLVIFNIRDCYSRDQTVDATFKLQASLSDLLSSGLANLKQAFQVQIAEVAKVQPIRITDLKFIADVTGTSVVFFTILDKTKMDGLDSDTAIVSAAQALDNVHKFDTEKDLAILVPHSDSPKTYKVMKGSVSKITQTEIDAVETMAKSHHYSAGSMAGLGISMLIIGLIGGASLMFFHRLKKRPTDVPYRVQD